MRFLFFLLLISTVGFSQNPTNYQYRTVRERLIASMNDSSSHIPRYNGIPSGLRVGMSANSGAIASDTLNHGFYLYSGQIWRKVGTEGIKCGLTCSSCGLVTWSGTGLAFDVTAASYNLNSTSYVFSGGSVTLDAADGTFDRFDAIVLTSSGLSKVTGTASSDPQLPQFDPCASILLTYVFVQTLATTPTQVLDELIYDENAETWSHATSGTISANFASTVTSSVGTKSIAVASWSNNANIIFTAPATLNKSDYTTLSFYIKLTTTMASNQNISVQFFNGTTAVSNIVAGSFSKTYTSSFQGVVFDMAQFAFTNSSFTVIKLIFSGSNSNTIYIDFARLQGGINQPPPPSGGTNVNIYNSDGRLTGNRTLRGLNNTYSLTFDSLNTFVVKRNNLERINITGTISSIISPNNLNDATVTNSASRLSVATGGSNSFNVLADSSWSEDKISYNGNLHGLFNARTLVDKSYVDSVVDAGGGGGGETLQQTFDLQSANAVMNKNNTMTLRHNTTFKIAAATNGYFEFKEDSAATRLIRMSTQVSGHPMLISAENNLVATIPVEQLVIHNPATTGTAQQAMIGFKTYDGSVDTTNGWVGHTSNSYTAGGAGVGPNVTYLENSKNGVALLSNDATNGKLQGYVGAYSAAQSLKWRVDNDSTDIITDNHSQWSGNPYLGGTLMMTSGTAGYNYNLTGTGSIDYRITRTTNAATASSSFAAMNIYTPTNGNTAQILAACTNYSNAGVNLPASGMGLLSNKDDLTLIAGVSGKGLRFTAGGYSSSNQIATMYFASGLNMDRRLSQKQGADVASAAGAITLGGAGNVFEITGTDAITLIASTDWQNGSEITLIFTSTASLTDGTANSGANIGFELAGNANFTASADDTITLVLCEIGGTQRWREKCRSVN